MAGAQVSGYDVGEHQILGCLEQLLLAELPFVKAVLQNGLLCPLALAGNLIHRHISLCFFQLSRIQRCGFQQLGVGGQRIVEPAHQIQGIHSMVAAQGGQQSGLPVGILQTTGQQLSQRLGIIVDEGFHCFLCLLAGGFQHIYVLLAGGSASGKEVVEDHAESDLGIFLRGKARLHLADGNLRVCNGRKAGDLCQGRHLLVVIPLLIGGHGFVFRTLGENIRRRLVYTLRNDTEIDPLFQQIGVRPIAHQIANDLLGAVGIVQICSCLRQRIGHHAQGRGGVLLCQEFGFIFQKLGQLRAVIADAHIFTEVLVDGSQLAKVAVIEFFKQNRIAFGCLNIFIQKLLVFLVTHLLLRVTQGLHKFIGLLLIFDQGLFVVNLLGIVGVNAEQIAQPGEEAGVSDLRRFRRFGIVAVVHIRGGFQHILGNLGESQILGDAFHIHIFVLIHGQGGVQIALLVGVHLAHIVDGFAGLENHQRAAAGLIVQGLDLIVGHGRGQIIQHPFGVGRKIRHIRHGIHIAPFVAGHIGIGKVHLGIVDVFLRPVLDVKILDTAQVFPACHIDACLFVQLFGKSFVPLPQLGGVEFTGHSEYLLA